jgi:hypothetical protein
MVSYPPSWVTNSIAGRAGSGDLSTLALVCGSLLMLPDTAVLPWRADFGRSLTQRSLSFLCRNRRFPHQ